MTTTECSERSRFTVVPVPETELPENPDLGVSRTQLVDSNPEGQNAELCRSCTCRGRRSMSCGSFWWKLLCSVTAVAVFASFGLVYWTVYQREEAAGAGRNLYSRRISSDGQDSVFACHFIDGKVESEEESRETCEVRKNSTMVPYCFSMLKQDERTPSTEMMASGCWAGGDDDMNSCVQAARQSADQRACVLDRAGHGFNVMYCCCLRPMCNKAFGTIPAIVVKNKKSA